ncbi:hypothetical protein, partial [Turicimonas muris]|uniref:hypothetical protein n=1 Tax=Turicimonas muris TaxID=1796652 RepID=UPI0026E0692D
NKGKLLNRTRHKIAYILFRAEHPFLSLFNNLLYVLFVGGFFSSLAMLYGLLVVLLPVRMNIYFLLVYSVQLQPNFA